LIVSHRHRFLFVKTKKTAGTSLEIALSGICGPEDVITPISPPDEAERRRLGYPGPQNLQPAPARGRALEIVRRLRGRATPRFRNHMPAVAIRRLVPQAVWDGYFKFCFERNPWDRALSLYHWLGGERRFGSLAEFLRSGVERPFSNYDRYSIDGVVALDRVYRYEELEEALADVSRRLSLPAPLSLPAHRAKGTSRADRRPYRDLIGPAEREWIEVVCAREIRLLDYRF
jgi:hypothetical protein